MKTAQVYFSAGLALAAALTACAPQSQATKKDDGALVEQRAVERWNLLIAHQAEKAYDYLTPGYRQTITREKYAEQKNDVAMRWKSAKVAGRKCDGDSCTVTVLVDVQVKMPGVGQAQSTAMPTEERWLRIDRNWYYLPDTRLKATPVGTADANPAAALDPAKHRE